MDENRDAEILRRLTALESKVDTVVTFTGTLEKLLTVWLSGGRGKLLTALARVRGGSGQ